MGRWQRDAKLYGDILSKTPFAVGVPSLMELFKKKELLKNSGGARVHLTMKLQSDHRTVKHGAANHGTADTAEHGAGEHGIAEQHDTGRSTAVEEVVQRMHASYTKNAGAHPERMLKFLRAFVLGPDLKRVEDMCIGGDQNNLAGSPGGDPPNLYERLWGPGEKPKNGLVGAFAKLEQVTTRGAHFAVGLLDESTPAAALRMAKGDLERVTVLPRSAHYFDPQDVQEFLLPRIKEVFEAALAGALAGGNKKNNLEDGREQALAFGAATESREAVLQDYSVTLGGGEWGDGGLISSLPQLASMAALGKRWETRAAGPAAFWPTGPSKAPSLAKAANSLDFQV